MRRGNDFLYIGEKRRNRVKMFENPGFGVCCQIIMFLKLFLNINFEFYRVKIKT